MDANRIEVENVAPQRVIGLSSAVPTAEGAPGVEALFERVIAFMDAAAADRAHPISWHSDEDETNHVYAGFLAESAVVPGLEVFMLPMVTVASLLRRGPVDNMHQGHEAIARWAESHHHKPSLEVGRWREVYLETDDADRSDWLIEIQLELPSGHADLESAHLWPARRDSRS